MHIYAAGDLPSYTSRYSEFLTLFRQRQEIITALKELEYIVNRSSTLLFSDVYRNSD